MAEDLTCVMCGSEIDSPVLVQMMWLLPDEERAITVGTSLHKVCTGCAEKVKELLEGRVERNGEEENQ